MTDTTASCTNARMKPLAEGYPCVEVPCPCGVEKDCKTCAGHGVYYEIKRIQGQWLPDEMNQGESELGEMPNW